MRGDYLCTACRETHGSWCHQNRAEPPQGLPRQPHSGVHMSRGHWHYFRVSRIKAGKNRVACKNGVRDEIRAYEPRAATKSHSHDTVACRLRDDFNDGEGNAAEWATYRQTKWIVGLTFIAAISAIVSTAFTGVQAFDDTARKQANAAVRQANAAVIQSQAAVITARAARSQIRLAHRSVSIAERLENVTERQLQISESAFRQQLTSNVQFFVQDLDLSIGKKLVANIKFINSSDHKVYNVKMIGRIRITTKRDDIALVTSQEFNSLSATVSVPKSGLTGVRPIFPQEISQEIFDAVKDDLIRIYVFGRAQYEDATGIHIVHTCASFYGDGAKTGEACKTHPDS